MPGGNSYQQQRDFDQWDSWTSMQAQKSVADQYREMMIQQAAAAKAAAQDQAADSESAMNFFEDMAPSLRKSKKIRIRSSQSDENPASPTVNKFAVQQQSVILDPSTSELGTIEDETSVNVNAWESDELESINADEVLKELRQKDRESRMLQHSQRKLKAKLSSGDRSSGFDAVKLS